MKKEYIAVLICAFVLIATPVFATGDGPPPQGACPGCIKIDGRNDGGFKMNTGSGLESYGNYGGMYSLTGPYSSAAGKTEGGASFSINNCPQGFTITSGSWNASSVGGTK